MSRASSLKQPAKHARMRQDPPRTRDAHRSREHRPAAPSLPTVSPGLLELLHEITRFRLDAADPARLRAIFARHLADAGMHVPESYAQRLRERPSDAHRFVRDVLRADVAFGGMRALRAAARKILSAQRSVRRRVRVWNPACGAGEHAYSVAMAFMEQQDRKSPGVRVFATDVDVDNLRDARQGIYDYRRLAPLGSKRAARFFDDAAGAPRVIPSLREQIAFAPQNVFSDVPFIGIDLVCCGTLLRYVDDYFAERLFDLFHHTLVSGGYLLLHADDPPPREAGLFERVCNEPPLYRRLDSTTPRRNAPFPIAPPAPAGQWFAPALTSKRHDATPAEGKSLLAAGQWKLLDASDGRLAQELAHARETLRAHRAELGVLNEEIAAAHAVLGVNLRRLEETRAGGVLLALDTPIAAVLNGIGALVAVFDPDGRILRWNHACTSTTGRRESEAIGRHLWDLDLLPTEQVPAVRRVFERLHDGESPITHEGQWKAGDGSVRHIVWTRTAVRDLQGQLACIVASGIDITEQRHAEDELRRHQAALLHVHRNMTAGELAGALAHEVSQPLSAIANLCEATLREITESPDGNETTLENVRKIANQARRAGRVIGELRAFIDRREMHRSDVDLRAIIQAARDLVQPEATQHEIRVELDIEPVPFVTNVVAIHMEQALVNLMQNALDALKTDDASQKRIHVSTQRTHHGALQVRVADNGKGFPAEFAQRAFEPFQTTKPGGLGLGLAISRSVIEANGGKLRLESTGPSGSVLCIELPAAT